MCSAPPVTDSGFQHCEAESAAVQASGRIPTLKSGSHQRLDWLSDVRQQGVLTNCQLNLGHRSVELSAPL